MAGLVQSVERAAAILQVLAAEGQPASLSYLAGALGLAKPTTHGLVQTLREVGFVDQDPQTGLYSIGAGLLQLGATSWDRNELRKRALNWTDALAAHTGEAALVAVVEGRRVVVAHHVFRPDTTAQTLQTGSTRPLHASAVGKVLLAHDPRVARTLRDTELTSYTGRTVLDPVRLHRELADIRDVGWSSAAGEAEPDVAGLAAPVRDRSGYVVAAVGIEGSLERVCDHRYRPREELVRHVVGAARSISRELGHGRRE